MAQQAGRRGAGQAGREGRGGWGGSSLGVEGLVRPVSAAASPRFILTCPPPGPAPPPTAPLPPSRSLPPGRHQDPHQGGASCLRRGDAGQGPGRPWIRTRCPAQDRPALHLPGPSAGHREGGGVRPAQVPLAAFIMCVRQLRLIPCRCVVALTRGPLRPEFATNPATHLASSLPPVPDSASLLPSSCPMTRCSRSSATSTRSCPRSSERWAR